MLLWRLSGVGYDEAFDGGYGLLFDGRWNSAGQAITYCSTSPSLCVLEKLVHVEDPDLLPRMVMVTYEIPDMLAFETVALSDLPDDWKRQETYTQHRGDTWYRSRVSTLLSVPSAVVPVAGSPDMNFLINHSHPDAALITIRDQEPFVLDPRLF